MAQTGKKVVVLEQHYLPGGWCHSFNLGGYRPTVIAGGRANRHEFGGLNDATFTMLQLLEQGTSAGWPF